MTRRDYTRKPLKGPLDCREKRTCQVLCNAEYTQPTPLPEWAVIESYFQSTTQLQSFRSYPPHMPDVGGDTLLANSTQ